MHAVTIVLLVNF